VSASRDLVSALSASDPAMPEALAVFDAIAGAPDPAPDSIEWSARLTGACDAARLTYYFDVAAHGAACARAAAGRFSALAAALDVTVPTGLMDTFAASVPEGREVLQVVLGFDGGVPARRRLKLYVVLRDAAPTIVDAMVAAAGARRPESLDPAKVYILGTDFGQGGLVDAKLYFRLDRQRLPGIVSNLDLARDVVDATRDVVLQRCLVSDRTQIYLHASNPRTIARHLARRASEDEAAAALCARHASVGRRLARGRLEPWIISFELRERRLCPDARNVYYHHVE
jgi:hypothetical protein